MNSLSNQWLVVYVNNQPAGYACVTTRGRKPQPLEGKRAIRIADFGILASYRQTAAADALVEKCLSVCRSHEGVQIWVNEPTQSPWIQLFEEKGFVRCEGIFESDALPLPSVCLVG